MKLGALKFSKNVEKKCSVTVVLEGIEKKSYKNHPKDVLMIFKNKVEGKVMLTSTTYVIVSVFVQTTTYFAHEKNPNKRNINI